MLKNSIILSLIFTLFLNYNLSFAKTEPTLDGEDTPQTQQHKTLEEMLKELKEERKVIEQQKLDEINAKRQEQENLKNKVMEGNETIPPQNSDSNQQKTKDESNKSNKENTDEIPKLIVRLRGKHSTKYLCEYSFIINNETTEKELTKTIVTDYSTLLKRPSLKVRADEAINFEFSETPKELNVYIVNDTLQKLKVKRGCIHVPDLEKKIVVLVEGIYENGYIKYAVVLDIRK